MSYSRRTTCRLCDGPVETVIELTPTPPANAFVPALRRDEPQDTYPLTVAFCTSCAHVQLVEVVDPSLLFEDYVYVSGTSPVFVDHFRRYAGDIASRFGLGSGDLAVEIGSNDGTLLRFLRDRGARVLGIDPARAIAQGASEAGIETMSAFFSAELAEGIRSERGPAAFVVANNVMAHIDDLAAVVAGVRALLAPGGVFVFEVSYLADVYEKILFDTIYHEHLDYHTLGPLLPFFARHGMHVFDAERVETHGGSLRVYVEVGERRPATARVEELVARERELGLDDPKTFREFSSRIDSLGASLHEVLLDARQRGRLAGYGAPAKATTLSHHFGIGADILDFVVDDSPLKQGLFTPGFHIPILPSSAIYERRPDYLLMLAWNFADSIMEKHRAFRDGGGQFIVPLPEVALV